MFKRKWKNVQPRMFYGCGSYCRRVTLLSPLLAQCKVAALFGRIHCYLKMRATIGHSAKYEILIVF